MLICCWYWLLSYLQPYLFTIVLSYLLLHYLFALCGLLVSKLSTAQADIMEYLHFSFFFPCSQLMERLTLSLETNLFTIASAPSATEKTSTFCNFLPISKYATAYVSMRPELSAFQSLANIGIDLLTNKWSDCYDDTIVILDGAQLRYAEGNFWKTLIKDLPGKYPNRQYDLPAILGWIATLLRR